MDHNTYDAVVVGAGAAGLIAAWELAQTGKRTAIVEAKPHVGGRAHTILDDRFDLPVEAGAEFVHGKLKLTLLLLQKAGADYYRLKGDIWQNEHGRLEEQSDFIEDYSALNKKFKELTTDIPVADFIDEHLQGNEFEELRFTLKAYVEGYYAADAHKASTFSLQEELTKGDEEQYRIEGGYARLIGYLHRQCAETGVTFFLSHTVTAVNWRKDEVEVITDQQKLSGQKVLITVPVGVLQSQKIAFSPAIEERMAAAKQLGFGPVVKSILQFDEPFWKDAQFTQEKDLGKLSFLFSKAVIPTWWTYYPKDSAMITGWSGGPNAEEIKHLSEEEILQKALESLSSIFNADVATLRQKLKARHIANWTADPHSCGAYSYQVVNGSAAQQVLKTPVENTIFFAGEGLHDGIEIGTVEAALISGRDTAHRMAGSFKK